MAKMPLNLEPVRASPEHTADLKVSNPSAVPLALPLVGKLSHTPLGVSPEGGAPG